MSPRNKSIYREPAVMVALIGLVGTVITAIVAPLIIEAAKTSTPTPVTSPAFANNGLVSTPTNFLPVSSEEYALSLLAQAKSWRLIVLDPFDRNDLGWFENTSNTDFLEAGHTIESGQYIWRIKGLKTNALRWGNPSKLDPVQDFYASVSVLQLNDLKDLRAGLIFRYQGNRLFYDFLIYMDGHFTVRYYDDNDATTQTTAVLANMPSSLLNPAFANKLTVIGIGNDYWFYINDRFVHHINDTHLSGGTIGLIAGVKEAGEEGQVAFDDFELRLAP